MSNEYTIGQVFALPRMSNKLNAQSDDPEQMLSYNSKVGVEIEGEGVDAPYVHAVMDRNALTGYWRIERDGSLRGRSFEAIFSKPFSGASVGKALYGFEKAIDSANRSPNFSARTSVHVHVNARDMTFRQLSLMFAVYLVFEGAIFNYAGVHRKRSNYCTKMVDEASAIAFLQTVIKSPLSDLRPILADRRVHSYVRGELADIVPMSKYSSVNLSTLTLFGTVEYRHHPGEYKASRLMEWINILLCMKGWAMESDIKVEELSAMISGVGPSEFLREVFGHHADALDYAGLEEDCYEGIRTIQAAIAGCRKGVARACSARSSLGSVVIKKQREKAERKAEQVAIDKGVEMYLHDLVYGERPRARGNGPVEGRWDVAIDELVNIANIRQG